MENWITVASVIVAVLSVIFAMLTYARGGRQLVQGDAAERAETITKLDFIANDLKDIKADGRQRDKELKSMRDAFNTELKSIRDTATHAHERAEAAHRRIDRAGIDIRHED